jgi:hypothetical protein
METGIVTGTGGKNPNLGSFGQSLSAGTTAVRMADLDFSKAATA